MLLRLFLILLALSSSFLSQAYSSASLTPLQEDYYRIAGIRYSNHLFTVDSHPVEGTERIEAWHRDHAGKVTNFAKNTFGKLEGRNWAFASVAMVRQQAENVFSLSDIYTIPHIFGSGVRMNMPEPSNAEQRDKQMALASISTGFTPFFADDERPGSKASERLADFINEVEALILPHIYPFL